ncbi:hypothetical protein ACVGOW_25555 [Pseudonocardia saturnea]
MEPARSGYGLDMAPDSPDWTVPAPLRALLWWPGVAFVLALVAPDAAVGSIAAAGLVLVALGALAGAVGRRLTRSPAEADDPGPEFERVTA